MFKQILDKKLLMSIVGKMKRDNFKPGYDNMDAPSAELWLNLYYGKLCNSISKGTYTPSPAIGFRIAKKNGRMRRLARLTAIDTVLQRAILDVFGAECEKKFSRHSHAYRSKYGTVTAINDFLGYASSYGYAAKIDAACCYDYLDFGVLEESLGGFTKSKIFMSLLMDFAKMPVIEDGELSERSKGILQGAPLSSLLLNIYFHRMDSWLEESGIPFVRYADDIVIFANTYDEARRLNDSVYDYLEDTLKLCPNRDKNEVCGTVEIKYLGYTFSKSSKGMVIAEPERKQSLAYYDWYSSRRTLSDTINILSDGILRPKDYSIIFESESSDTDIPVKAIDTINIFSNVAFDGGLLEKAFDNGITINVFDRKGELLGTFTPNTALKNPRLTSQQIMLYEDSRARLAVAKEFVLSSLHNIRLNIRYYRKQDRKVMLYTQALDTIDHIEDIIKECEDYNALLLLEARVREAYYSCFDSILSGTDFEFVKRTRRPPENEVNAMLSLGNTVLYSHLAVEISKTALDSRVGFLHATNRRLNSLNLDFADVFKPLVVDRAVFTLINRGVIKINRHFEHAPDNAVYLNNEGKRLLLEALYDKLDMRQTIKDRTWSYKELMKEDICKLVRHCRSGDRFKAFRQVR